MTTTPNTPRTINTPHGVQITDHAAASLAELLELCDTFLRGASDQVRTELREFLATQPDRGQHPRPEMGWLIDMLGFNALYLHGKLAAAAARQSGAQR